MAKNRISIKSHDFIIVGAGSAGCVLANRLSSDPSNSVLLIEAGASDKDYLLHIPGAYGKLFRKPYDWGYWTEPQKNANNRKLYIPRGKTLGGCSSVNAMAYVRGNKKDYDEWASMGNAGWSFKEVLPYFTKSENNEQYAKLDPGMHGQGGELNITFAKKFRTPYATAFVAAGMQAGIPENSDYNGRHQTGISFLQFSTKDEKRLSTASAFLKPAKSRKNLTVLTGVLVNKIEIKNDRAIGMVLNNGPGAPVEVLAHKEVILSAGAINSPQVMMLSGIGAADELKANNIPVVMEMPGVGKNLQDHLFFSVSAISQQQVGLNHGIKAFNQLKDLTKYYLRKSGPLTIGVLEAVAFLNLDNASDRANFQLQFAPLHPGKGYDYDLYDLTTLPTYDGFTILPSLVNPSSRGYVGIKSKDPRVAPVIQPNFLKEESDLEMLLKGGKKALEVMQQSAFDPFRKEVIAPPDRNSDDAWVQHIRNSLETIYHPVGTCQMGLGEMAVVDHELRVHGIKGLRIVDASIMPKIITGNTNAPVIMIAEKAADMILSK